MRQRDADPAVKEAAKERDDYTCQKCGYQSESWMDGHRIVPLSRDGSDDPSNIATLCQRCHGYAPTGVETDDIECLFEIYVSTGYIPEGDFMFFGAKIARWIREREGVSLFYPDEHIEIALDYLKYNGAMEQNWAKDEWWVMLARLADYKEVRDLTPGGRENMSESEFHETMEAMYGDGGD